VTPSSRNTNRSDQIPSESLEERSHRGDGAEKQLQEKKHADLRVYSPASK
jgi:hypothetical protein